MGDDSSKDLSKPYHVRTMDGAFVKGYDTFDEAEISVTDRNNRAEASGLSTRYQLVEK